MYGALRGGVRDGVPNSHRSRPLTARSGAIAEALSPPYHYLGLSSWAVRVVFRMHIALFYQYYHSYDCPAVGRHYAFVRRWAERHKVTIITSDIFSEERGTPRQYAWAPEGVEVRMLQVPYANQMGIPRRALAFASYAGRAFAEAFRGDRPDVIVGSSTPLTAAASAAWAAKAMRRPWVFEVRDLWPTFPVEMGALKSPLARHAAFALERNLYDSAAHIVTVSPDMTEHVRAHGIDERRLHTLWHGTDLGLAASRGPEHDAEEAHSLRALHGLGEGPVVLYAGTLGRANAIPTLLATAERAGEQADARGVPRPQFVIIGHGYHEPDVRAAAARLLHVHRVPLQPRHAIFAWYRLASLTLVTFLGKPSLRTNAPAKFFDSLGAGTPVVVTNPGWTEAFVEEHGCGWSVPPESPNALAARVAEALADPKMLARKGRAARAAAERLFDRTALADEMEAVLIRAAGA